MDPEAALKELRELAAQFVECPEAGEDADTKMGEHDGCECAGNMERMGELFQGLDQWLRKGGFLPKDWACCGKPRNPTSL